MPEAGITLRQLVIVGENPDDCWEWIGQLNPKTGYGKKQYLGRTWLAHRWVWEMLMGPIPEGFIIDHLCRNRRCVNLRHLRVTTLAENCRTGSSTVLTQEQAKEIKAEKNTRRWGTGARLARRYGVSPGLIHDIWAGRAWKEL